MTEPTERFMAKVSEQPNGCWLWQGAKSHGGYGSLWFEGRRVGAHRVAYQLLRGAIPAGLTIDHLCRTVACVNPAHLEPVTMRENLLRGNGLPGTEARQTHCLRGHPLSGPNLRVRGGKRFCHQCAMDYQRQRRAEARA